MKKRHLAILIAVLLFPIAIRAEDEPNMEDLVKDAKQNSVLKQMISMSAQTLRWANARLREERKPLLFCEPRGSVITAEDALAIIASQVQDSEWIRKDKSSNMPMHLLSALVEKYPC
ncbi:hypothetical protein [Rhizobium sp. CF080]|uniref:hypothetical protein n=1 Tax=Rhizobium sp. (strain CF080) TaxID=1144310 RepID=UPI0005635C74|nr:hypothetical protein [Rhizobium sp. CF080]